MEFQERLPYDYLITTLQRLPVAGQKPAAAIYERSVGRSEVFDEELPVLIHYSRVTARDLGFWIVLIQVDVRENPAIRIPASYVGLSAGNGKFLSDSAPAFNDQFAAHLVFALPALLFIRPERISTASGGQHKGLPRVLLVGGYRGLRRSGQALGLTPVAERPCRFGHARRGCKRGWCWNPVTASRNLVSLIAPGALTGRT
jgi:hypothetical protein